MKTILLILLLMLPALPFNARCDEPNLPTETARRFTDILVRMQQEKSNLLAQVATLQRQVQYFDQLRQQPLIPDAVENQIVARTVGSMTPLLLAKVDEQVAILTNALAQANGETEAKVQKILDSRSWYVALKKKAVGNKVLTILLTLLTPALTHFYLKVIHRNSKTLQNSQGAVSRFVRRIVDLKLKTTLILFLATALTATAQNIGMVETIQGARFDIDFDPVNTTNRVVMELPLTNGVAVLVFEETTAETPQPKKEP